MKEKSEDCALDTSSSGEQGAEDKAGVRDFQGSSVG